MVKYNNRISTCVVSAVIIVVLQTKDLILRVHILRIRLPVPLWKEHLFLQIRSIFFCAIVCFTSTQEVDAFERKDGRHQHGLVLLTQKLK